MLRHSSPYCFRGTSFCFCVSTGTMACVRITLHSLNYSFSDQPRYPPSFHSKRSSSKLFKNPNFRINYGASVAKPLQFSVSSTVGAPNEGLEVPSPSLVGENDLLIVGPGVLGRIVAEQWRKENPDCQVLGQTMTTDHHEELVKIGITPSLREVKPTHQFPFVIFCAPPSKSEHYAGDVKLAASNWSGEGSFLFTSSSALFDCNDNGPCDEDSPVVPMGRSPRTDILLETEKVVLDIGGCVLRLAGLYKLDRGAHSYWLKKSIVEARPDHVINLIHYEDAASLTIAILKRKLRSRILLGCDDHPLSRQEVMDIVNRSGKFTKTFEGFAGTDGPLGKRLNNSKTRDEIRWEPKYPGFAQFLGIPE